MLRICLSNSKIPRRLTIRRAIGKQYSPTIRLVAPDRDIQRIILQLFDFRIYGGEAKVELGQKAQRVAMLSTHPVFILREAFKYLSNQRIVAPGYTTMQDMVSSDGQRIETQINTINAQHANKYFGLKKGVSSYTLSANHVPINAKIIGTHEHESHFVFDILHNNTTDIKPERHTTDTHGTNQVNFFILRAFEYQFAPRYRDLHKKMDGLVGFYHLSHYGNALIKPSRKVFDKLIIKE